MCALPFELHVKMLDRRARGSGRCHETHRAFNRRIARSACICGDWRVQQQLVLRRALVRRVNWSGVEELRPGWLNQSRKPGRAGWVACARRYCGDQVCSGRSLAAIALDSPICSGITRVAFGGQALELWFRPGVPMAAMRVSSDSLSVPLQEIPVFEC